MKQLFNSLTKADKILNISVLILTISIWTFSIKGLTYNGKKLATIEYKQQKLYAINLDKENGSYNFFFGGEKSYYEIKDGSIRLLEMPKEMCPNSICSDTGWIRYPGQAFVCSPNQLIGDLLPPPKEAGGFLGCTNHCWYNYQAIPVGPTVHDIFYARLSASALYKLHTLYCWLH